MGATGVKLLPIFHGFWPDHPGFLPVYQMCRTHKKPMIVDLSYWYLENMPPHQEPGSRRQLVKCFADYARLLRPVFCEFSAVPFSLAHIGTARAPSDYDEIFKLIADYPNVSCDVAAAVGYSPPLLERLVRAVGAGKVMYGTDWPYWASGVDSYRSGTRSWTMVTERCPNLKEEERRQILAENAERFVKFQLPLTGAASGRRDEKH
jgi:predicted TIM-barrel fold metal-dependent hydrolase